MKKVMFVLVSLLLVSACFALESGPSNAVGYVKIDAAGGAGMVYTQFGLPFVFWDVPTGNVPTYGTESRKPSDICGTQPTPGTINTADRIYRQDSGEYAYRRISGTTTSWTGSLETPNGTSGIGIMEPARAYWYINRSGAAIPFVLAGQVDTSAGASLGLPTPMPTVSVNANAYASISWRDSRVVARDKLNLRAQGFTGGTINSSDRVKEQATTGRYFYCNTATPPVWSGTLPDVTPGQAYWIWNRHATGWNYTYNASGVPLTYTPDSPVTPDTKAVSAPMTKASNEVSKTGKAAK